MQLENENGVVLCFIIEHTTTLHVLTVFEDSVSYFVLLSYKTGLRTVRGS